MASLINSTRRAATEFKTYPRGINDGTSNFNNARTSGIHQMNLAAQIRSGQMVARAADGLVLATGLDVMGVMKHDMVSNSVAVEVLEQTVLSDAGVQLNRNRIVPGSLSVRVANNLTSAALVVTTNYTINNDTGVLTRAADASTPADGSTVYVTYAWNLDASMYEFEGRPFHSEYGDAQPLSAEGRAVVIEGSFDLFTSEWEQSRVYNVSGAASNLYCNANGRFDSTATSGAGGTAGTTQYVGKVIQLPTRDDIYLGLVFNPGPAAVA